jgi:CxxC motif-containing protein
MKEMICIVCPRGCHLSVGEAPDYPVTGNSCPRGEVYAREEAVAPKRVVTATCPAVITAASLSRRVPVRTTAGIPRARVRDLVIELSRTRVTLPVRAGDVVLENWADTGVSVIATRNLD